MPGSKNNWAAIGGIGGFAFVAIGAAIWFWSGGFGARPPPAPIVGPVTINAAEALTKGKAAFDRTDYAEAIRWYRQAADQGNAGAQTNIGYLYEHGLGVTQNYLEALRWYRMAADQGQATAQSNIGVFYDKGYGVAQNYGEAMRWYHMAADQGNVDAEYNLALLYANGHGVPPDLGQARQWMQKAADAGDPEAKKWLGNNGG
jgi:TPR repeat protein